MARGLARLITHFGEGRLNRLVGAFERAVDESIRRESRRIDDLFDQQGCDCTAIQVGYDNTVSGLAAVNVQDAIDEVDGLVDTNTGAISALDGRVTQNEGDIAQNESDITQLQRGIFCIVNLSQTAVTSGNNFPITSLIENGGFVIGANSNRITLPYAGIYFCHHSYRVNMNVSVGTGINFETFLGAGRVDLFSGNKQQTNDWYTNVTYADGSAGQSLAFKANRDVSAWTGDQNLRRVYIEYLGGAS